MPIPDPETYVGPLPSTFQRGDKVIYQEEHDGYVGAVEFHDDGRVEYLFMGDTLSSGGVWCNSVALTRK